MQCPRLGMHRLLRVFQQPFAVGRGLDEFDIARDPRWSRAAQRTKLAQQVRLVGVTRRRCERCSGERFAREESQRLLHSLDAREELRPDADALAKHAFELPLAQSDDLRDVRNGHPAVRLFENARCLIDARIVPANPGTWLVDERDDDARPFFVRAGREDLLGEPGGCAADERFQGHPRVAQLARDCIDEERCAARTKANPEHVCSSRCAHQRCSRHGTDDASFRRREIEERVHAAVREHPVGRPGGLERPESVDRRVDQTRVHSGLERRAVDTVRQ